MATIYEKTAGALIATPGRTVATFPSGLCRVDQKYVCTTANAATHRATLAIGNDMPDGNDAPAIDGLKIYPAPQEIERGDGFTEFIVSAYGRTQDTLQGITVEQEAIIGSSMSYSLWKISGSITLPSGESITLDMLNVDVQLFEPFGFVFANREWDVLRVTQIQINEPRSSGYFGTVSIGGASAQTFTRSIAGKTRRKFLVEYTTDGVTALGSYHLWIIDPTIAITATRSFGEFVEIDISTQRENTEPTVV